MKDFCLLNFFIEFYLVLYFNILCSVGDVPSSMTFFVIFCCLLLRKNSKYPKIFTFISSSLQNTIKSGIT